MEKFLISINVWRDYLIKTNKKVVIYCKLFLEMTYVGGMILSGFNLGDALFQLFYLGFIVLIVALILSFFRSNKKRKNQLDRIEKKIDDVNQRMKKNME